MLTFIRVMDPAEHKATPVGVIRLGFEARRVCRQRVVLADGTEAGLLLPRGTVLRHGDGLTTEDGQTAVVEAAAEALSRIDCEAPLLLARAAYHLGNRHASVMIEPHAVTYPADPVLDAMVRRLGLAVMAVNAPFEPETGAYGHGHHGHGHHHGG